MEPLVFSLPGILVIGFALGRLSGRKRAPSRYYRDPDDYRCPCGHTAGTHGHALCWALGCDCHFGQRQALANAERWATTPLSTAEMMKLLNPDIDGTPE